ncbi:mortality factor 4-like protein 1 isoform X4 [Daktulosphaira vitifoliae]|uniref:mortality factor 4-like protein 1 isoform X4 n=1 Tax=Daktulosphaira vitifoliae TaxID=58002 RepID=UPI0021AAED6A|nr:mortality factor 4-like protein 1 isoform X4 [Daktulosphaira vitifoliae]
MAADNYRFAESDSLLCYHGPMLYEAKCLKRRKTADGKAQYFIHYKGWNSKWEEWVDDDRVLAVNTVNMNKMASLKALHSNSKKSGGKRSVSSIIVKEETVRNTTPPVTKGKKRKHSELSESNQIMNISSPASPASPVPKKRGRPPKVNSSSSKIEGSKENIKKITFVVPAPVFLKIPSKYSAEHVIEDYINSKSTTKPMYKERALNIGLSLMQYFNVLVNTQLLYPIEREIDVQVKALSLLSEKESHTGYKFKYQKNMYPKEFWCSVYGPVYLLRMCVKLPSLLSSMWYSEKQLAFIVDNFHDFLKITLIYIFVPEVYHLSTLCCNIYALNLI